MKTIEGRKKSISKKILLILPGMVLIITTLISLVSIIEHRQEVIDLKSEQATNVAKAAIASVDTDKFKQLEESNQETAYYAELKKLLSEIKISTGVEYLFVIELLLEKEQVRYIAEGEKPDDNPEHIAKFNDTFSYKDYFSSVVSERAPFIEAYSSGQIYDVGIFHDPTYGNIMTEFVPITDSSGETVGMVGVIMDADDVINQANRLMYTLIAIAAIGLLALLVVSRILIRKTIIQPLKNIQKIILAKEVCNKY